jgi:hypothetical protein
VFVEASSSSSREVDVQQLNSSSPVDSASSSDGNIRTEVIDSARGSAHADQTEQPVTEEMRVEDTGSSRQKRSAEVSAVRKTAKRNRVTKD